ncbi:non-ribosomal peptide synthetase, partial [Virgisporangium aurantiacum]|uniref:non-ribosomal peptide synthetase n=1 Tax=Virgisporangium aurantiacum TaxID=175570 RepID=UPI00194DBF12
TAYGITETSCDSTTYPLPTPPAPPTPTGTPTGNVPIGRPLPATTIHILDPHLQPVPLGTPGELHLTGPALTRGYHHQPHLTAHQYIANPHANDGSRLYRTGDLVRQTPDGNLHYLGRTDHQLRIHGHRIEPADIETALTTHPAIKAAAITTHPNHPNHIHAYLIPTNPHQPPTPTDLRTHLSTRLPHPTIPTHYHLINHLPTTTTGKLDRTQLPHPTTHPTIPTTHTPPTTPTQHHLITLIATLLNKPPHTISTTHNFFDLGGHSLLATQLTHHINTTLHTNLHLTTIFNTPTIHHLATTI